MAITTAFACGVATHAGRLLGALANCFVAGTLVSTEHGLKAIEEIRSGEKVCGYNFRHSAWSLSEVIQPLQREYSGDVFAIEIAGGSITATGNHPFWVVEGEGLATRPLPEHVAASEGTTCTPGRWVNARNLSVDDVLLFRKEKTGRVTSIEIRSQYCLVYNLNVADLHTFAVGKCGILAHNRKSDIQAIRDVALEVGIDDVRGFGDFVEELKDGGVWDGIGRGDTLTWGQLMEAAQLFLGE